jgi:hypothetical protein
MSRTSRCRTAHDQTAVVTQVIQRKVLESQEKAQKLKDHQHLIALFFLASGTTTSSSGLLSPRNHDIIVQMKAPCKAQHPNPAVLHGFCSIVTSSPTATSSGK